MTKFILLKNPILICLIFIDIDPIGPYIVSLPRFQL